MVGLPLLNLLKGIFSHARFISADEPHASLLPDFLSQDASLTIHFFIVAVCFAVAALAQQESYEGECSVGTTRLPQSSRGNFHKATIADCFERHTTYIID